MGYSLNVENLVHMAIDAKNGHINQHFLVRLLQIVVRHTNLDKYYVDFTGNDENRAHDVYTGIHDMLTIPLNDSFEISYDEEDMLTPVKRSRPRPVLKQKTRQIVQYENFEESRTLEMNEEFDINPPTISAVSANQEMTEDAGLFERSVLSEECKEQPLNNKPNVIEASLQYTIQTIIEQLNNLTSRVNEIQTLQKATVMPSTLDCQNDSTNSCEVPDESFLESSVQTVYSSISVDLSEPEIIEKIEVQKSDSSLNLNKFLEEPHKYYVYNNDQRQVSELIQKLYNKTKKIKKSIEILRNTIINIPDEMPNSSDDSTDSSTRKKAEVESYFTLKKRSYDRLNLENNLKMLSTSADGDTLLSVFGRSIKRKDLFSSVSIREFRQFDLDYRTNFQTIHSYLEFFNEKFEKDRKDIKELQRHLTPKAEFLKLKKAVISTHIEIMDQIKEHILKDPETMGIVRFIKDGTCMSCARPAVMRTTNDAPCCNKEEKSEEILQNKCRLKKPANTKYKSTICSDIPMSTNQNKKKADLEYALDRYKKEDKEIRDWIAWLEKHKCEKKKNILPDAVINSSMITVISKPKPYSDTNIVSVPAVMPKNTNKYYNHKIISDEALKPNIDKPSEEPMIMVFSKPSPSVTNFVPQPPIVFPKPTKEENKINALKNIKIIQKRNPDHVNFKALEEYRKVLDPDSEKRPFLKL